MTDRFAELTKKRNRNGTGKGERGTEDIDQRIRGNQQERGNLNLVELITIRCLAS